MRIQHNISAINSHRQLGVNTSNSAKNLEKLSSGFRINRAGDDAAGLAISEKMRGQIRGLDMASKNAQDGISLIQTAEGSLNETHSILQRMRELSVQSANGTYQDDVDRENLDKEVSALKSEIDRIASSTHFNKIQLLDGSIGGGSTVTSTPGQDATNSVSSGKPVVGGANAAALGSTGAGMKFTGAETVGVSNAFAGTATMAGTAGAAATKATIDVKLTTGSMAAGSTFTIGSTTINSTTAASIGDLVNQKVQVGAEHFTITAASTDGTLTLTADVAGSLTLTAASFNASGDVAGTASNAAAGQDEKAATNAVTGVTLSAGESITIDGKSFTKEDIEKANGADLGAKLVSIIGADAELAAKYTVAASGTDGFTLTTKDVGDKQKAAEIKAVGKQDAANRTLDLAKAKAGDTIKIGDTTFELVEDGKEAQKGNVKVTYDKLNQSNTANNLWTAIKGQSVDGIGNAVLIDATIKLESTEKGDKAKLPEITLDTTARAAIGVATTETKGTEHTTGGNNAMRGWTIGDATTAGTVTITLPQGKAAVNVAIAANTSGKEIAEMLANTIRTDDNFKDANDKQLYDATVNAAGELIVTAKKAETTTFDIAATALTTTTNATLTSTDKVQSQVGKTHDKGGTGASTTLDFSKAGVGDLFSINGKTYEVVDGDKKPLTAGATALKYNDDKQAMIKDLLSKTGSRYDDAGKTYKLAQNGPKLTIANQEVGEASTAPAVETGTVGKNGSIEVGGVTVDTGKSNALNGYKINIITGDNSEAKIDSDKKTINVTLREGANANDLKTALNSALANSANAELAKLQVGVKGTLKVGTDATASSTEITFKNTLKAGDTVKVGGSTYQIGKAGDEVKEGATLLEVAKDAAGNFTGAAIADALSQVASDKYTAKAEGNKLTLTANKDVDPKEIKVSVSDQSSLIFQIGANGTEDQRVSLNIGDMSAKGIKVDAVSVGTADDANRAIETVDKAINQVSGTRADLGALQNRLEHTVNNLGTTSENLTAAEARIRDVDMAKEMMEFTKNNILTQAAQAMLAQANQQPQGVLQLLQ